MKRYIFIIFIFILVISTFFIFMQPNQQINSTASIITNAFYATGAKAVSTEIYMTGSVEEKILENRDMQYKFVHDIIIGAGGRLEEGEPVLSFIDNDDYFGSESEGVIHLTGSMRVSMMKSKQKGSEEDYRLSVSFTDTSQNPDVESVAAGMKSILKKYGVNPDVNICITGSLDGNLQESELEAICEKVFISAGAGRVEGIYDKGLISVAAFSPSIHDSISMNGKLVNLNVAVRYNSYEGKTYIWLATPVITTEY